MNEYSQNNYLVNSKFCPADHALPREKEEKKISVKSGLVNLALDNLDFKRISAIIF